MTMPSLLRLLRTAVFCGAVAMLLATQQLGAAQSEAQDEPESGKVTSKYDKSKDETTVEVRLLQLRGNETQKVVLSVSASYKGQKPKEPEDIIVIISVFSSGSYRYPDMMAMQVLIDGKKVSDVLMLNLDKRKSDDDYLETLGTRMKYNLFKRLLKAPSAELQLQNLRLPLDETQMGKLREVDALLHPSH
jgi:hypothetical protein